MRGVILGLCVAAGPQLVSMRQVPCVGPFDECDLADQLRGDRAALLHFLCC